MATVLIVDDEPDILEVLQISFENAGYEVLTAVDGVQALEVVERSRPDAMLLDIGMPHVDGWEVLERIKSSSSHDLAEVPVVMVTAWTSLDDRLRGGIEGAVRYVGKPFDPDDVVSVVDELLAPGAPKEPELRRSVQRESLERLARRERGVDAPASAAPRVHLTRLEHAPAKEDEGVRPGFGPVDYPGLLASLSPRQREVVELIVAGRPVREVADRLGVSRSNVYAILRRVARKAGRPEARHLIHWLRRVEPGEGGSAGAPVGG